MTLCFLHRLEAEIEAARLKAKEEMMQGIQMAEEMAQQELSEQKIQYENRIKALERELVRIHANILHLLLNFLSSVRDQDIY